MAGDGIGDTSGHRSQRGEVDDGVDAGAGPIEDVGVEDRPLDELDVDPVQVGGVPRREVVDHDDAGDGRDRSTRQSATEVGTDEAGTTRDQDTHGRSLTGVDHPGPVMGRDRPEPPVCLESSCRSAEPIRELLVASGSNAVDRARRGHEEVFV
jgi:hypothetical protein